MPKNHCDERRPPAPGERDEDLPERWERKLQQARLQENMAASGGLEIGQNLATQLPLHILPKWLATHMHVVGSTGGGKSYFLEAVIKQLIAKGQGVCVIDPTGDLYHRLLDYCSFLHINRPELKLQERLIPFDIAESQNILGFNPMQPNARAITYQVVALIEAIRKCWGQDNFQQTPRLARWLFNTNYAVIESQSTFLHAYEMVLPRPSQCRNAIIRRLANPRIRAEWEYFNQLNPRDQRELTESSFNKLKPFVEPPLRPILGQCDNTLNFRSLLDDRKILLVNLAKQTTIGDDDRHLLGTLLVNEILAAAFSRPRDQRPPFFLFVDEFQHFVTKDMCEILDGGRKYGLHLTLAHQHLHQLKEQDPELYYSVLGNARCKVVFGGLDDDDLDILAKELYTGELDPEQIKDEIWQTKFRPVENSRIVTSSGGSDSSGAVDHQSLQTGQVYIPGSDFWSSGTYHYTDSSGRGSSHQRSSASSSSQSQVPFYEFHEFKELSSRTFRALEEQLYIKKAQLKRQPRQHCALLIPDKQVQMMKVSTLRDFAKKIEERNREELLRASFETAGCFKSPEQAEREIQVLEQKLLSEAKPAHRIATKKKSKSRAKAAAKRPASKKTTFAELVDDPFAK